MVLLGAGIVAALGPVASLTGNLSLTISSLAGAISGAGGLTATLGSLSGFLAGGVLLAGIGALALRFYDVRKQVQLLQSDLNDLTEAELKNRKAKLEQLIEEEEAKIEADKFYQLQGDEIYVFEYNIY